MAATMNRLPWKFRLRVVPLILFVLGTVLILWSLFPPERSRAEESLPDRVKVEEETLHPRGSETEKGGVTLLPIAEDAATALASPDANVEDDLSTIELLLAEYARHYDGNPVGENLEITAALLGRNRLGVALLAERGSFLNSSGELIDRWGTPYFFHQQSGEYTEIRSAGQDRILHTADDLVR